jgi:TPR repeat protein
MFRPVALLLSLQLLLAACSTSPDPISRAMRSSALPRNMSLTAFNPHRPTYSCKREAEVLPIPEREAEAWLQEGLRITSHDRSLGERDFVRAVDLWSAATDRGHWKAMMNLAGVWARGAGRGALGVRPDPERAVQILERAMLLNVPSAFSAMGTYHSIGLGVKRDPSRAYAFWQLAADMGSAEAQGIVGKSLIAGFDNPKERFWSNRPVAEQMLECAASQGNGKAARDFATYLRVIKDDTIRAIPLLHAGVIVGSEECATDLASLFRDGQVPDGRVDEDRADRYSILADAIYYNRDLRFPNLDKVLPLPPAQLPKWNGDWKTLIDAAKGVTPTAP